MRLNRYLASSGACSRRYADELIFSGRVTVNGIRVETPGLRIGEGDRVILDGKPVIPITQKRYWVMNKPRGVVTTLHDPQGRITVRDILKRYFRTVDGLNPVGRLDRDTCGVLLFTDDGDLHYALTHPSRKVVKEYRVMLLEPLPLTALKKLRRGIRLEDGFIRPDHIDYRSRSGDDLVINLHSGKNRIIRRMMEKVGGEIRVLRRLSFAGITPVGLEEGEMRELTPEEVKELRTLLTKK